METIDWCVRLFIAALICFSLGSSLPLLMESQQRLANFLANGCLLLGGMLSSGTALLLLLTRSEMTVSAWKIIGDVTLAVHFDTLAAFFLLVIGVMAAICSLYAGGYAEQYYERKIAHYLGALMNVFVLSLIGVIGMDTALTFLICWETMALSSFCLVMFEHEQSKVRSGGYMYLIMTHVIGVCLSFAFLILYMYTGSLSFADYYHLGDKLPEFMQSVVFFLFFIGFGAKMGLFPINVWLPRAYPVAPSSATALMSSAMIKTAVYAWLRVSFDFMDGGPAWWGLVIIAVGVVSVFVGIMLGVIQNDLKRFLAYSSVENMGIICVSIGASLYFQATGAVLLGGLALTATLYHVFSHSVFKSLLFMVAGALWRAVGTCNVSSLGGLIKRMPFTAGCCLIGGMSLASLPPFGGFISEWALMQSLIHLVFVSPVVWVRLFAVLVVAVLGFSGALAVVAVVKHFGMAFLAKPRSSAAAQAQEVNGGMRLGMGILCILSLVLGVWPGGITVLTAAVTQRYFAANIAGNIVLYVPFESAGTQGLATFLMAGIVLILLLASLGAVRLFYGKSRYVLQDTWTCGAAHSAQLEYTATSYSHPVLRIFQRILGVSRVVTVEQKYVYYPKRIHHGIDISARVGDNVYKPLIGRMVLLFKWVKMIQSGNLQAYLSYMVVALIITLLWIR